MKILKEQLVIDRWSVCLKYTKPLMNPYKAEVTKSILNR